MTSNETAEATAQRYRVEAVSRAAGLLKALRAGPAADLATLSKAAGTPASFTEGALRTLERHGLVRRDAQGSWALGLVWLRLADVKRRQLDLRELATPIMRRMRDDVDETVILAIRRGGRRVNIDYVESTQAIRRVTQFGYEMPLHVGATGRVLLSGLTQDELGEYLAGVAIGMGRAAKLFDFERFQTQVADVRRVGYSVAHGEITRDTSSISAPVFDHTGSVVAALTISMPTDRFTDGLATACVATVRSGAAELSRLLGHVEPEPAEPDA